MEWNQSGSGMEWKWNGNGNSTCETLTGNIMVFLITS